MKLKALLFLAFITTTIPALSQSLGQWKVHLPYNKARVLADAGDRIFCASETGLFYFTRSDNSVTPLSKITGLSELSISTIAYNEDNQVLVVAYSNANIDLIVNNKIINISDIKRKNLTGDKNIYGISFRGSFAYLSCGFGIVVLDLLRYEIKDTYIIGPNGIQIQVFDTDFLGQDIYAATEEGIYRADVNNPNLSNFANWTEVLDDSGNIGDYNLLETYDNRIFINYAKPAASDVNSQDEILMYDGSAWGPPPGSINNPAVKNYSFHAAEGNLHIVNGYSISVYNNSLNQVRYLDQNNLNTQLTSRDAMPDSQGILWIADFDQGLIRVEPSNMTGFIVPDGPQSDLVSAMAVENSHLWITHATRTAGWFNAYTPGNISDYKNGDWKTYNSKTVTGTPFFISDYFDMMSIAVDPSNSNHVFVGSKGQGVLEMLDGLPVMSYRDTNSTLQVGIGNPTQCQAVGMDFDKNNNLWVLNGLASKPVNVRTTAGDWKAFSIPGIPGAPLLADMTVDSYNQKWVNVNGNNAPLGNGIAVFNDNGTLDDASDDKSRFISSGIGKGNLPSTDIRAIVEDRDGEMWLGTGKGVAVIYSPGSVITSDNYDAQQVLIKQDGINQYLLESEVVTAIAIDGANRKWFGTESGGVFLMSADGTQQILNFNETNSPLLSNYILAIAIDQKNGDVYFGTNKGVISYRGDAIEGDLGCNSLFVYPNPVRENYTGPIAIKGVVPNGSIKITDISGNLVYETVSYGAQAIWYGKNFKGEKASTGIYLVFSTDAEGQNTCVTKLLFVN